MLSSSTTFTKPTGEGREEEACHYSSHFLVRTNKRGLGSDDDVSAVQLKPMSKKAATHIDESSFATKGIVVPLVKKPKDNGYEKLGVKELKELLKSKGLKVSGQKKELIERLLQQAGCC